MTGRAKQTHYPVALDLRGRLAVVIGGGTVAEGIIGTLLDHGADVTCIAPLVTPAIDSLVAQGLVTHEERGYVRGDIAGAFIAVSATDSIEVDRAVYLEAEGQGCLVTAPDTPELSNFRVLQRAVLDGAGIDAATAGA